MPIYGLGGIVSSLTSFAVDEAVTLGVPAFISRNLA